MTAQIITMDRLYPHYLSSQASWTWHSLQYGIVLSWDLLSRMISLENGIPCSFITTPELSGPLHISSDIYHTQITGYSLFKSIRTGALGNTFPVLFQLK